MAQCPTCTAGIGQITVYRLGKYVTIECPRCGGTGHTCTRCDKNPERCGCDAERQTPRRPKK